MKKYTIYQAKSQLSKLLRQALNGEEVIISNRNNPLVRLTVIEKPDRKKLLGMFKGKISISKDFNETPKDFKDYM